jgi:tight adherence protein B
MLAPLMLLSFVSFIYWGFKLIYRGSIARKNVKFRGDTRTYLISGVAAVVSYVVTGWPISPIVGVAITLILIKVFKSTDYKKDIERLDAIASFIEMLRDTMAGSAGITQALLASCKIAPASIEPELRKFAERVTKQMNLSDAIVLLAHDLNNQMGDLLCSALLVAAKGQAYSLSELLNTLADSTRQKIVMLREINSSRASVVTNLRTVIIVSVGFFVGSSLLAKSYLSVYQNAVGQIVLVIVGALYLTGLLMFSKMMESKTEPRISLGRF